MIRSALPQNYTKNEGTIFEDFETFEDFVLYQQTVGYGSISPDTANYKTGTKSLKITADVREGVASYAGADKTISANLSSADVFRLWLYKPAGLIIRMNRYGTVVAYDIANIDLYFSSTSNFSKYFKYDISYGLTDGWNCVQFSKDDFINSGGESWDNTMIKLRVRVVAAAGKTANISFDSLTVGVDGLPRICVQFDNGWLSQYTEAFAYMQPRGINGTIYTISNAVGTDGYITLTQMQEMEAAGWTMANHTADHVYLTEKPDLAAVMASIGGCRDWLELNGFTRGARHIAYPAGFYNSTVFEAMAQLDMKTGRAANYNRTNIPTDNYYELNATTSLETDTLDTAKALIDNTIASKGTLMLYFHIIELTPSAGNWSIANFQGLIDYIVARKVKCVTIDEWYEGLTNPRYRSLSLARTVI